MPNRPSGVLTSTDREFLRESGDYYEGENARQSRYQRRRDIRGRIIASLLDFRDIRTYLDDEQRRKIFSAPEENGAEENYSFQGAIESLLGWIYLGCREGGIDFERLLEIAVAHAEEDYQRLYGGEVVDVDVDLNVEVTAAYEGIEELGRALEAGDRIRARNIYKLPMMGDVPVDPEKVDVVRILPERAQIRPEREKAIVDSILREYLGIEAEIEIVGVAEIPDDFLEELPDGEPTAAVPRDEYRGGRADGPDS